MTVLRIVANLHARDPRALAGGHEIGHPLSDEEWDLRRFFLRDPVNYLVNVLSHQG